MDKLTPDTSFAILQAAQKDVSNAADKVRSTDRGAKDARQLQKIEDAAQDFEAVFMAEMLKPMFEGVQEDPMFGSSGEKTFHGLMLQEYGKIISDRGGVGIAEAVEKYMVRVQEESCTSCTLTIPSNSHFWLFPVPVAETDTNPNVTQAPGYSN